MKTVIIICEGETEEEFCKSLLSVYLQDICRIEVRVLGGNCTWKRIKDMVVIALKAQKNAFVTTFFDYYGLNQPERFPKWKESTNINAVNIRERAEILEQGMLEEIEVSLRYRFIPYVQLHEFEALLFNKIEVFDKNFKTNEFNRNELIDVLKTFPDPELINQGKETSPSHRLMKIVPQYNKIVDGNILAETIGIDRIRQKNKHFNDWIEKLKKLSKE